MRLPRLAVWSLRVALLLASLCAALLGFSQATGTASSPVALQFDPYLHRVDGAPADPINLIFYGAGPDTIASTVHGVLGWPVAAGSPMVFVDQGVTRQTSWQMGQEVSRSARLHLRIEAADPSPAGGYVLAAVHRDDDAACGHVGTAFDEARRRVAAAFAGAGYAVVPVWLGNTAAGPQCDGTLTAGDGSASVIDLTRRATPAGGNGKAPGHDKTSGVPGFIAILMNLSGSDHTVVRLARATACAAPGALPPFCSRQ